MICPKCKSDRIAADRIGTPDPKGQCEDCHYINKIPAFKPITPAEALYAFVSWITTREKPLTASAKHDSAIWAQKIDQFCKVNDLSNPGVCFEEKFKLPEED